jgi:L-asparaginase
MSNASARARVRVISLGGTIAMTQGDGGGVVPKLTAEMLAAAVPGLREVADIETQSFRQMPGAHLAYADLEALAAEIAGAAAAGVTGVVVTQGTDTIEETAFALDRLVAPGMPVVVTGAMRNPTLPGADGPANLLAAVQVACSADARGLGGLVVMNDEVHAARYVRKLHTSSTAAFSSGLAGAVGWLVEGTVRIVNRPAFVAGIAAAAGIDAGAATGVAAGTGRTAASAATAAGMGAGPRDAQVALLTLALGDDATLVEAAAAAGFAGLVIEGMGGGHVPPAVADALERAAAGMPVVLASRAGAGEVLSRTYGFPGGEIDLQRRGLVRAGWLDGIKAKVLLTLLLRHGAPRRDDIAAAFAPWGGGAG